jgi:spore maturation protein CgeB
VYPETLEKAKKLGIPIFCIYPDVSFYDHGTLIPRLIEYYDYIFTTKSFGVNDLKRLFNFEKVSLIHHCIDPMVHKRKMEYDPFKCDVSFIGSYSLKKFNTLQKIINSREDINLKIYGNSWGLDGKRLLNPKYLFPPVHGDLYALAIYNSKINLGLLSEAGSNSAAGDLITSRSFHIPGSGGFMIHERTTDILNIFEEGESVVTFIEHEELLDLIKYYLKNDQLREKIANNASEIVWKYHKSDDRVDQIIDVLKREDLLK